MGCESEKSFHHRRLQYQHPKIFNSVPKANNILNVSINSKISSDEILKTDNNNNNNNNNNSLFEGQIFAYEEGYSQEIRNIKSGEEETKAQFTTINDQSEQLISSSFNNNNNYIFVENGINDGGKRENKSINFLANSAINISSKDKNISHNNCHNKNYLFKAKMNFDDCLKRDECFNHGSFINSHSFGVHNDYINERKDYITNNNSPERISFIENSCKNFDQKKLEVPICNRIMKPLSESIFNSF